jgi:DNA processing protein
VTALGEVNLEGLLESVPDRPAAMWARGTLPSGPGVAIVGTRRCTAYGRSVATALGRAVAASGRLVVSGLARGIDAAAHRGTVEVGGVGYAVLGSGIDVLYPPENRELADRLICAGGGVLSEYPPGTPPAAFRFPARNRIIAGLSAAVVVVEAPETGGALITARLALEQGKEVLAVPGDIDRPTSMGCNLLIRDGAHPVLSPSDLLETLEFMMGPAPRGGSAIDGLTETATLDDILAGSDRPPGEILAELARADLARAELARAELAGKGTLEVGQFSRRPG